MTGQLELIEPDPPDWRLDERTIRTGLTGIAAARRILADERKDHDQ